MKFLTSIFLLCALVFTAGAQSITSSIGTSTGGNGTTDASKAAKFDPYGYLHSKRFVAGTGTGGTLSTENAFTDARAIAFLSVTATLATSDIVTTASAHSRQIGDGVVFTTGGSLSGTGITSGTVYYVKTVPTTTTLTLSTTPGGSTLDITGAGTGTHTFTGASPHAFADERTITGGTGLTTDAANSFDVLTRVGSGSGTWNHLAGYQFRPTINVTGVTNIYGYFSLPVLTAGCGSSTFRHFTASNYTGASALDSEIGFYFEGSSSATYKYSLQSGGSSARMVHNGRAVFGSASYSGLDANSHFHVIPQANMRGLYVSGYSLTSSNAYAAAEIAGTWNTSGTPTLVKANVTDTASNAASLLMDLQVGGTSKFAVSKAGQPIVTTKTPSSASDTGVTGTIAWDSSYIYVCTATNTWKRVAIATW